MKPRRARNRDQSHENNDRAHRSDVGISRRPPKPNKTDFHDYRLYGRDAANFTLKPTSKAIDAGVRLPNVNDDCTGQGPDLGAIESRKSLPVYGPRTTQ